MALPSRARPGAVLPQEGARSPPTGRMETQRGLAGSAETKLSVCSLPGLSG